MTHEINQITIFGGSGYLGAQLVRQLKKTNKYRIIIVDVSAPPEDIVLDDWTLFLNIDILTADNETLNSTVKDTDVVFFKVGKLGDPRVSSRLSEAWQFIEVNALSLQRLSPIFIENQVKKIIVDSSITAAADFKKTVPISEENTHGIPTNFYGLSKALLEELCMFLYSNSHIQTIIIRYPRVYIPTQNNFLNIFD